jgi:MerR family copper efflux transcriptional regulator
VPRRFAASSNWGDRSRASADVKAIAFEHIAELERKAAAIQAMIKTLKHLANLAKNDRPDCPIIEEMANPTEKDTREINARFGVTAMK